MTLRAWRVLGLVAPTPQELALGIVPPVPRETPRRNSPEQPSRVEELRLRHLRLWLHHRERMAELVKLRARVNYLERKVMRLMEQSKEQRAIIARRALEDFRAKNRIIVLKARNYDLRRQLAEANAFLESK